VILDRRDDATERLLDFAENVMFRISSERGNELNGDQERCKNELHLLVKGVDQFIEEDVEEARQALQTD
jgi:5-methyltetrahydrofolate--homocysteine methyltransferase